MEVRGQHHCFRGIFDSLSANGSTLPVAHEATILGLTISRDFCWNACLFNYQESKQAFLFPGIAAQGGSSANKYY